MKNTNVLTNGLMLDKVELSKNKVFVINIFAECEKMYSKCNKSDKGNSRRMCGVKRGKFKSLAGAHSLFFFRVSIREC